MLGRLGGRGFETTFVRTFVIAFRTSETLFLFDAFFVLLDQIRKHIFEVFEPIGHTLQNEDN